MSLGSVVHPRQVQKAIKHFLIKEVSMQTDPEQLARDGYSS